MSSPIHSLLDADPDMVNETAVSFTMPVA